MKFNHLMTGVSVVTAFFGLSFILYGRWVLSFYDVSFEPSPPILVDGSCIQLPLVGSAFAQFFGRRRRRCVTHFPYSTLCRSDSRRRVNSAVMSLRSLKRKTNQREICRSRSARGSLLVACVDRRKLAALTRFR